MLVLSGENTIHKNNNRGHSFFYIQQPLPISYHSKSRQKQNPPKLEDFRILFTFSSFFGLDQDWS